jgi:dTDP-4-dehydrorhamnose reductase
MRAIPQGFDYAFISAAAVPMDRCRQDPIGTALVNVTGTANLVREMVPRGTFVVAMSSNRVFSGRFPRVESANLPDPVTEYGRQKVRMESEVLKFGDRVAVVRLTKVIDPAFPLFQRWKDELVGGAPIHPFIGMSTAPVSLETAVRFLSLIGETRRPGIAQISGDVDLQYVDVGRHVARRLGFGADRVQPIEPTDGGLSADYVSVFESLDPTEAVRDLGLQPPSSWEAVDSAVTHLSTSTGVRAHNAP